MSVQVKRRRDTAANVAAYVGAQGELIVDLTNNRVTVHDGVTPGGWAAAKLSDVPSATRVPVSDVNYAAGSSDRTVAFTAITAPRIVSLPAASGFPTGLALRVMDESGSASASNTITLSANGSDLIDGASSAILTSAYGYIALQSNGAASPNGKWTIVDRATSNLNQVGIGTAADPSNPLSVYGASALFNGTSFNFTINKSAAANTASILFQDNFSGRAQLGLTGDDNFHFKVSPDGSSWLEALNINTTTGQPSFPLGIAAGQAVGFRNRLRNAGFTVNQRAVSGAVTLAAGAYGHDGVKAGASGATYTFATSGLDTTLNVTAGSIILPVEASSIEGGAYTLSQAGTAQARVWQGTGFTGSGVYGATPLSVAGLSAATQTNVEFSTGTVLRPQLEPGAAATLFERRPAAFELALCQRYFETSYDLGTAPGSATSVGAVVQYLSGPSGLTGSGFACNFKVTKRADPTITFFSPATGVSGKVRDAVNGADVTATLVSASQSSAYATAAMTVASSTVNLQGHWTAAAEL